MTSLSFFARLALLGFGTAIVMPDRLPAQNPAAGVPANACELFTLEEINAILGRKLRDGTNDQGSPQVCRYRSFTEGVTISLEPGASAGEFRKMREMLGPIGPTETIAGLGDEAFLQENQLYTRKGRYTLNVKVGNALSPKNREEILKLARAGLAKLP
jgi:hypothetical protein